MQKMKVFRRLTVLLLIVCLLAGIAVQAVDVSERDTTASVQEEQKGSIDTAAAQKALTERRAQAGLIRASADELVNCYSFLLIHSSHLQSFLSFVLYPQLIEDHLNSQM